VREVYRNGEAVARLAPLPAKPRDRWIMQADAAS
jgi:hypothetical protein